MTFNIPEMGGVKEDHPFTKKAEGPTSSTHCQEIKPLEHPGNIPTPPRFEKKKRGGGPESLKDSVSR